MMHDFEMVKARKSEKITGKFVIQALSIAQLSLVKICYRTVLFGWFSEGYCAFTYSVLQLFHNHDILAKGCGQ